MAESNLSFLILIIAGIAGLVVLLAITIPPFIEKSKDIIPLEEECDETGEKISTYHENIANLLNNYNPNLAEAERANQEKKIIELYKEYKKCFPQNTLALYMETNLDQRTRFAFIFILKNQKHYDDTTIDIAKKFTISFPESIYNPDVNDYLKQTRS